jgi:hypothetical protein
MRNCRCILILVVSGFMTWATVRAGDAPEDLQTTFAKAIALMQAENFVDALPLLRDVANKAPDRPNVFWNLGIAPAAAGDKQLALKAWLQYHTLEPNDQKGAGKLIQSYQALDMRKERDRERDILLTARAALPPAHREKMPMYARDQFDVTGAHGQSHWTYQLLTALPTYDAVRASVISAVEGKLHPISSSTSSTQK